jgi:hypothetical protein
MAIQRKYTAGRILVTLLLGLFAAGQGYSQSLDGSIHYSWDSPQEMVMSGPLLHFISLGDKVTLTLTGRVDLRPYEVEKKRGGFLGIGRKRYREVIHDYKDASEVLIHTGFKGTSWSDVSKLTSRTITLAPSHLIDAPQANGLLEEVRLECFIKEPGKNYVFGASTVNAKLEIDSKGRMPLIIDYLRVAKPTALEQIRPLLEKGNLMRQYPNEICDAIFRFYEVEQADNFALFKTPLLEYLLNKSPNNGSIRVRLAQSYLNDGNFAQAKLTAKSEAARLKGLEPNLTSSDRFNLAGHYIVLADAVANQQLGIQGNAFQLALSFYNLAEEQYIKIGGQQKDASYRDLVVKQSKAYQRIGSEVALKEAAVRLETYLQATE